MTHFDPVDPPREVTLYFCPACGQKLTGNYNLDTARKRCTKTWHRAMAKPQKYVAA